MPNEETKVCTARLPVALLADLKECAADQHRSVNSILWSAAEDYIRAWRAAQSQEHAEFSRESDGKFFGATRDGGGQQATNNRRRFSRRGDATG